MIRCFLSLATLALTSSFSITAQTSNDLHSRHFGVLSEEEIRNEEKMTVDMPYRTAPGILYWTCSETKYLQFKFTSLGYDEDEKQNMADAEIEVSDNNVKHNYIFRRGLHSSYVKKFINEWNRLIDQQPYVCISGYAVSEETKISNGKNISTYFWTWDRLKTKRGCVAFYGFDNGC